MLHRINGSTMVTFELASYLLEAGADVVVYTNVALDPARSFFKKAGVKVITAQDEYKFNLKDFDYVWVHSLTLPRTLLDDLTVSHSKYPAFIFLHMSALDSIPDEHPWIYDLEKKLSSLSLYISEGTLATNEKYGLPSNVGFFRNPALPEFYEKKRTVSPEKLEKLLIVSNHPPKELLEAKDLLIKRGITVDGYGEGQEEYSRITPEILAKYDAVVTIGKTVQYCLTNNTPVFVYDWYGGLGWLTPENYQTTRSFNFSGRFTSQKTSAEIVKNLIDGYADAVKFQTASLEEFAEDFLLDNVLEKIFTSLKPKKLSAIDAKYIESAKAAELCSEIRFISSEELGKARDEIDELRKRHEAEIKEITSAKSYRLMTSLLKPYTKLKAFVRKKA